MQPRPMLIARQHQFVDAKGKGEFNSERPGGYDITSQWTGLCGIDNPRRQRRVKLDIRYTQHDTTPRTIRPENSSGASQLEAIVSTTIPPANFDPVQSLPLPMTLQNQDGWEILPYSVISDLG